VWAFATVGRSDAPLLAALAVASKWRVLRKEFQAQNLANTAWAFARASSSDTPLLASVASAAKWHLDEFTGQNLANTAWAVAPVNRPEACVSLFAAMAVAAEQVRDLNMRNLANMA